MVKREGAAPFCRAGAEVATNKADRSDPRILARSHFPLPEVLRRSDAENGFDRQPANQSVRGCKFVAKKRGGYLP